MNSEQQRSEQQRPEKQRPEKQRPRFMSPKPRSPTKSNLVKRKYNEAFGEEFEDDRYNQHIPDDFFQQNIGHNVIELHQSQIQVATDSILEDFRINLSLFLQNEAGAEANKKDLKFNVIEVLAKYEEYLANKK